jgi:hypothetical protein
MASARVSSCLTREFGLSTVGFEVGYSMAADCESDLMSLKCGTFFSFWFDVIARSFVGPNIFNYHLDVVGAQVVYLTR